MNEAWRTSVLSYPKKTILAFCHSVEQQRLHFGLHGQSLSTGIMDLFLLKIHRGCNPCEGAVGIIQLVWGYIRRVTCSSALLSERREGNEKDRHNIPVSFSAMGLNSSGLR